MRYETTNESRWKSIRSIAEEGFKNHVLKPEQEEGPVRMWLCHTPGTGVYHFRVVAAPGMLTVYGDVGHNILMSHGRDMVNWIRGSCNFNSYVIEKIITKDKKEFMPSEAEELLKWRLESVKDEDDEYQAKTKEFVNNVNEDWEFHKDDYDSEWKFCEAYIEHGGEAGDLNFAFGYTTGTIWTVVCLQKFVELYNEYYGLNKE